MKRIFLFLAAAVTAIASFTSCEETINALLNNYTVGDQLVIVGSAELSTASTLSSTLYGFKLNAKDEKTPDDYCQIIMGESEYTRLLKGEAINMVDCIFYGSYNNGEDKLTILGNLVSGEGSLGGYNVTAISNEGTVTASISGYNLTLKCSGKVVCAKEEDPSQTKEFKYEANYHGEYKIGE